MDDRGVAPMAARNGSAALVCLLADLGGLPDEVAYVLAAREHVHRYLLLLRRRARRRAGP
jgi:hypothetical protein